MSIGKTFGVWVRVGGLKLPMAEVPSWTIACIGRYSADMAEKGMPMKIVHNAINGFQQVLERKESEVVQVLRKRDGMAIGKSADQMDEIRLVNALPRIHDDTDARCNYLICGGF